MILQKINAGVFNEMVQDETGTFVMNKNQPSHVSSEIDSDTVKKIRELSKLRKSIELDLKAIATATKISTNQLKNIESFKFDKLPPNPMRLSFIDQYCSVIEKANKKLFYKSLLKHKNQDEINMYSCPVRFGELTDWPL